MLRHAEREGRRAETAAAREKLIPLEDRLAKLLAIIPPEVQGEGLFLETLRRSLKGGRGRGAHRASLGDHLRRAGYVRERRWRAGVSGFRALWYPPSIR
jgi:hypothetical protein